MGPQTLILLHKVGEVSCPQGNITKDNVLFYVGPTPFTVPDFWQMIWEQNSYTIVMLTNLKEGAKVCNNLFVYTVVLLFKN